LYHRQTGAANAFVSIGIQGYTKGYSGSSGLLFVKDLPDLGGYTGISGGPTGSIAKDFSGIDASLTFAKDTYKGERPTTLYVGPAAGLEVSGGASVSNTWTAADFILGVLDILGVPHP
jgi:hypothetical protein